MFIANASDCTWNTIIPLKADIQPFPTVNLIVPPDLGIPISSSLLETSIQWTSQVDRCSHTPVLQAPNAVALPHTSPKLVVLMNCAVSAAHAVILMLWTSDCRAGDYRQLLYPARWGRSRLFSQTGCVGGLSGVTGLGGGGVGRVCGWVLAGSRTGCAMGLSRHAPSCLFGCGWWLAVVPRVCGKGRGHAGGVPSL